jgi:hypothetical protein
MFDTGQHWCNQILDIRTASLDRFILKKIFYMTFFIIKRSGLASGRIFHIRSSYGIHKNKMAAIFDIQTQILYVCILAFSGYRGSVYRTLTVLWRSEYQTTSPVFEWSFFGLPSIWLPDHLITWRIWRNGLVLAWSWLSWTILYIKWSSLVSDLLFRTWPGMQSV